MYLRFLLRSRSPSVWILMLFQGLAILAALAAPVLAFRWIRVPFPGFLVEQTLVVNDIQGNHWSGYSAGIRYPQRIVQIDDKPVGDTSALMSALSAIHSGNHISVRTISPEGQIQEYPDVVLSRFGVSDFLRIFWLPYLIGLVYLALGAWVFSARGDTLAGKAFVYFCLASSVSMVLLFDLYTTHMGNWLWTFAIAQQGGALISLGLLFPEVAGPVKRRAWVRFLPYLLSVVLSVWGLLTIGDLAHPWRYITAWRFAYFFTAAGILIFLIVMIYRQRVTVSAEVRQQIRIIMWGGIFAFIPLGVWFAAPIFNLIVRWNPGLFMPFLILFPISLAVSILRYRLWNLDIIINRTIVYSVLSILFLLVYFAIVMFFQKYIDSIFGYQSGLGNLLAMFVVVVLFNPLKNRIQLAVDRRFYRRKYDVAATLASFSQIARDEIDLNRLIDRFIGLINETLEPEKALFIIINSPHFNSDLVKIEPNDALVRQFTQNPHSIHIYHADVASITALNLRRMGYKVITPVVSQEKILGLVSMGARRRKQEYLPGDLLFLDTLAGQVAPALQVAQLVQQREVEAVERQLLQHEMQVARLIQQTLLPKTPPVLPGWEIAVRYQPARAVGGDFYDFFPLPDNRLVLLVGDVTDKGVPAALLMATTRSILRGTARRMFSPGKALSFANQILIPEMPEYMFVTCLYAILDTNTGRLQYANAGQTPPYRYHNHQTIELRASGMPLGLLPDMVYEEHEAVLEPGDSLLLYSDGIVEAHNRQKEMFGFPRLSELMSRNEKMGDHLVKFLVDELSSFTGPAWEQEDDITLLVVNRLFPE